VSTWEDDAEDGTKVERLGLAYQDFIIHLIGSVQEQQKQIDTQQAQIQAQQVKIEEQSQAINTLTESVKSLTEHLATLTAAFNKIVKE
jgi:septal ring factor EnvC (AmiA/AmiB activator)